MTSSIISIKSRDADFLSSWRLATKHAKMALVDRVRNEGRDQSREFMEEQKPLHKQLKEYHRNFQRLLAKRTFPVRRDRMIEAMERSKSFVEILSLVELEVPTLENLELVALQKSHGEYQPTRH